MKLARLHSAAIVESYWHVQLAVGVAIILQFVLNQNLIFGPKILIAGGEVLLLIALTAFGPRETVAARHLRRALAILLIALISVANVTSLVLIISNLLNSNIISGRELLVSGMAIYLTNIIIFGLWYWELDDPKDAGDENAPTMPADFLFPQMTMGRTNRAADTAWVPTFFDYLYVSITNGSAFSPTDTLPLTHRAKLLMSLQSITSLVTVALVAARAVNILT